MDRIIISIFVENNPGVLARVVLLFSQRVYNIESLTVSATDKDDISRITICTKPSKTRATIDQIIKQIKKLIEVKEILLIEGDNALSRDLALIRFSLEKSNLDDINNIINKFDAKIIHLSKESIMLEIAGNPSYIDECLEEAKKYNISEVCRTGIAAIEKSARIFIK